MCQRHAQLVSVWWWAVVKHTVLLHRRIHVAWRMTISAAGDAVPVSRCKHNATCVTPARWPAAATRRRPEQARPAGGARLRTPRTQGRREAVVVQCFHEGKQAVRLVGVALVLLLPQLAQAPCGGRGGPRMRWLARRPPGAAPGLLRTAPRRPLRGAARAVRGAACARRVLEAGWACGRARGVESGINQRSHLCAQAHRSGRGAVRSQVPERRAPDAAGARRSQRGPRGSPGGRRWCGRLVWQRPHALGAAHALVLTAFAGCRQRSSRPRWQPRIRRPPCSAAASPPLAAAHAQGAPAAGSVAAAQDARPQARRKATHALRPARRLLALGLPSGRGGWSAGQVEFSAGGGCSPCCKVYRACCSASSSTVAGSGQPRARARM